MSLSLVTFPPVGDTTTHTMVLYLNVDNRSGEPVRSCRQCRLQFATKMKFKEGLAAGPSTNVLRVCGSYQVDMHGWEMYVKSTSFS